MGGDLIQPKSVYFDTNIYYHLFGGIITPDKRKELTGLIKEGYIVCYDSPANILEICKHLHEDYEKYRNILQLMRDICGSNNLGDTHYYVKQEAEDVFGITNNSRDSNEEFSFIKRAVIEKREGINPWLLYEQYEMIFEFTYRMNFYRPTNILDLAKAANIEGMNTIKDIQEMWEGIISKKDFDSFYDRIVTERFFKDVQGIKKNKILKLKTIFCYREALKVKMKWLVTKNKKLTTQDYMDTEQTVYLKDFDYFVTHDIPFTKRLKEAYINTEYSDKVIDFDSFIKSF